MDISIIIVSFNTKDLLLGCLASLFETVKGISFEVWVVDNNSIDGTVEAAREKYPTIKLIENTKNLGFAAANNQAFSQMNGDYALLLNTDTVLSHGAVKELFVFMETNPEAGMACGQLLNLDGSKQNSIANFPTALTLLSNETFLRIVLPKKFPSKRREYESPLKIDSCIGACLMIRKKAMDDIGFFDERYFFFFEETDWAYRMKRGGWGVYFVPTAKIFHSQGKTVGSNVDARTLFYKSRYLYFKKWHPHSYPLFHSVIFLRLLANIILSLMGLMLTGGFNNSIRKKFIVYNQLLIWHLHGCPSKKVEAGKNDS